MCINKTEKAKDRPLCDAKMKILRVRREDTKTNFYNIIKNEFNSMNFRLSNGEVLVLSVHGLCMSVDAEASAGASTQSLEWRSEARGDIMFTE